MGFYLTKKENLIYTDDTFIFMKKLFLLIFLFALLVGSFALAEEKVEINFFYGATCPHCAKEAKFLEELKEEHSEIELKIFEISRNVELIKRLYNKYNVPVEAWGSVPVVFVGEKYFVGYSESQNEKIENCVLELIGEETEPCEEEEEEPSVALPFLGKIKASDYSLSVLSIILGVLDGFNVCSLGALIMILALVLSLKSRKKILIFGGLFILTTAVVYGLLITVWYKIFSLLTPYLELMRMLIGSLGIIGGLYCLRSFLKFRKQGPTCEMDTGKKVIASFSSKFKKYLENSESILLIIGLVFLFAGVITIVEFPCSSVVPLFFAGVLANAELNTFSYIFYIALFTLFYMVDEIIIFLIAFFTMTVWLASGKFITRITLIQAIVLLTLGIYYLFGSTLF